MTCDFFCDWLVGDGLEGHCINHDLGQYLNEFGAAPGQPGNELPWSTEFDASIFDDPDVLTFDYVNQRTTVYGFTFSKPE
jgi:hypothetical protein